MNNKYGEEFNQIMNLGNFLENEKFYSELYVLLEDITKRKKTKYTEMQDNFIIFFNNWKRLLLSSSYEEYGPLQTNNIEALLELIQYPLLNTYKLKNKSYLDFNINIKFFVDIFRKNSNTIAEFDSDDQIITVDDFEFTKTNKLKSFKLSNGNGIQWVYNSKYKVVYTVFADGSKLKHNK